MTTIGFLHPGQMGVTLAANADAKTLWAGNGRSQATADRAASAAMTDVGDVATLCRESEIIVSICPPDAALEVAQQVAEHGFDGIYIDANAVAPATSNAVGAKFDTYIDGGVIGPPATTPGTTRLYLAGPGAGKIAGIWDDSALDVRPLSESAEGARASALKMAYAGWTKGQSALLLAVTALARSADVTDALQAEWDISQPGLSERSSRVATAAGRKAWRFAGEMSEIAASMAEAGLPPGFHRGAEDLYRRMTEFKDVAEPELDDVLRAILGGDPQ